MNGLNPASLGVMIPIIALIIPIVAILTKHQREMAEIIHGSQQNRLPNPEVDALRQDVQELKQLVHQQMIALDGLTKQNALNAPTGEPVRERLGEGS